MNDLVFGIVFLFSVYVLAGIMNRRAHSAMLKERAEKERERLKRIDDLYGRNKPHYPDENL